MIENLDEIIDDNQLQFVSHTVKEYPSEDGIDVEFIIVEGDKIQLERVNVGGNNVTNETVVRSALLIDEGDPFSKTRLKKSIDNIKALNIFETVEYTIKDGSEPGLKVLDIQVSEKATGEIMAGAGYGTEGGAISFSIKEKRSSVVSVLKSSEPSIDLLGNMCSRFSI